MSVERVKMTIKLLLDTDIGSDIDDAVCLAHLLANSECELAGITTVTGEPELRARLASVLCRVAGKKVPIFPGAEVPFLVEQNQNTAPQAGALDLWEHDRSFPKGQAVPFMRDMIRSHPGEIILLTIGPLTNVGLLFSLDPEIPSLLKALVSMCGVYTNNLPGVGPLEWNAMADPHATEIVYRRSPEIHRSIGLDVTCRVCMSAEEVKRRFRSDLLAPVLDFAQDYFKHRDYVVFHDPLAAVSIFNPSVCDFQKGSVEVELASRRLTGLTHWIPGDTDGKHEVAMNVDPTRFFEYYFSVF